MMGHKGHIKTIDEDDALTRVCRLDLYKPGQRKAYKQAYNRRIRRQMKQKDYDSMS